MVTDTWLSPFLGKVRTKSTGHHSWRVKRRRGSPHRGHRRVSNRAGVGLIRPDEKLPGPMSIRRIYLPPRDLWLLPSFWYLPLGGTRNSPVSFELKGSRSCFYLLPVSTIISAHSPYFLSLFFGPRVKMKLPEFRSEDLKRKENRKRKVRRRNRSSCNRLITFSYDKKRGFIKFQRYVH